MARRSFGAGNVERTRRSEVSGSDSYPDEVSIDLDNKDPNAFEIVEIDDMPDDDQGRPNARRSTVDDDDSDLLDGVADKTKKRIDRLKFETNSERRQRETAERQRDEAVSYARTQAAELADLRKRMEGGTTALAESMRTERESRINDAKRRFAQANADGDGDAMAQASADMSLASAELAQITARTPKPQTESERQPEQQRQPAQQQNQLAPNVAAWIDHNRNWFNKDQEKTAEAMSIHYKLVAEGVRPDSSEYTQKLDKRMRSSYPEHQSLDRGADDDTPARRGPRRSPGGEPGGRADENRNPNPRRVTLTSTEMAIAKRLGVSPQAYAAEKLKRDQRENGVGA